jgi:hypothetical protein
MRYFYRIAYFRDPEHLDGISIAEKQFDAGEISELKFNSMLEAYLWQQAFMPKRRNPIVPEEYQVCGEMDVRLWTYSNEFKEISQEGYGRVREDEDRILSNPKCKNVGLKAWHSPIKLESSENIEDQLNKKCLIYDAKVVKWIS